MGSRCRWWISWFAVFLIVVTRSDGQTIEEEVNVGTDADCGNAHLSETRESGTLVFPPLGESDYRVSCEWVMTIDSGSVDNFLTLSFTSFNLGDADSVTITDEQFGGDYNVEFSINNRPTGDFIKAFKDIVQVKFKSDSNPSTVGGGFKIDWTSSTLEFTTQAGLPRDTAFRTVLANADYTLSTPNYPGNYPSDTKLYWVLTAAEGDRIQMNFEAFALSLDDSVTIYEGIEEELEFRKVRYTGSKTSVPKPVVSRTNQVLVVFYSSPYVTDNGFQITYHVYVYRAPSTTVAPKQTPKPLTPEARAVVIVVCCLLVLIAAIVCAYVFYFRPQQRAEEQQIARELYDNGVDIQKGEEPQRPMTATQAARLKASALMKPDYGMSAQNGHNGSPVHRPTTASRRPTTAAQRVNSAMQIPSTVITRPGTASQRPGTANQRPGTASSRGGGPQPNISWQNENDGLIRTSTTMNRADSGWGKQIEDDYNTPRQVNLSVTNQSGMYSATSEPVPTYQTPQARKDALPPLELGTDPIKVKKKKKKRSKQDPPEGVNDNALASTTPRSTASGGDSRPTSARPGSARSGPSLRASLTSPELTKLPGQVVRPDDEDDDWSI